MGRLRGLRVKVGEGEGGRGGGLTKVKQFRIKKQSHNMRPIGLVLFRTFGVRYTKLFQFGIKHSKTATISRLNIGRRFFKISKLLLRACFLYIEKDSM